MKIKKSFLVLFLASGTLLAQLSDDVVIKMVDDALKAFPEVTKEIPVNVRRISFYSLRVDRKNVSQPLLRQIQGKIESAFLKAERPVLVFSPELKPIRIISKEDSISFVSGFQSTDEVKDIARKLRLDGMLEGELLLTKNAVYVNLRIFDAESMAIVWSKEFSSLLPPEPQTLWTKFGFGIAGIPVSKGLGGETIGLPDSANYYQVDLKILNRTVFSDRAKYVVSTGILYLFEGINSSTATIVSKEKDGIGTINLAVKFGIKLAIFSSKITRENLVRDWLSVEFGVGRIFGHGTSGLNLVGVEIESEITKDLSFGIGLNFVPISEITYATNATAKVGGLMYEISFLRFNF